MRACHLDNMDELNSEISQSESPDFYEHQFIISPNIYGGFLILNEIMYMTHLALSIK